MRVVLAKHLPPDKELEVVTPEGYKRVRAGDLPPDAKVGILDKHEARNIEFGMRNPDGTVSLFGRPFPIRVMSCAAEMLGRLWKPLVQRFLGLAHQAVAKHVREPKDPAAREVWRVLDMMVRAERTPRMKQLWTWVRDLAAALMEDPAYYWRIKWALSQLDMEKLRPTEADLYWLRQRIHIDKVKKDGGEG